MGSSGLRYSIRSHLVDGEKFWCVYDTKTAEVLGDRLDRPEARRWADKLNAAEARKD